MPVAPDNYYFWKCPGKAVPGPGLIVVPGLEKWVVLHKSVILASDDFPDDAIPASAVVGFLEGLTGC